MKGTCDKQFQKFQRGREITELEPLEFFENSRNEDIPDDMRMKKQFKAISEWNYYHYTISNM